MLLKIDKSIKHKVEQDLLYSIKNNNVSAVKALLKTYNYDIKYIEEMLDVALKTHFRCVTNYSIVIELRSYNFNKLQYGNVRKDRLFSVLIILLFLLFSTLVYNFSSSTYKENAYKNLFHRHGEAERLRDIILSEDNSDDYIR